MALLKEIQNLSLEDQQQVRSYYSDELFPVQFRHHCAYWIEDQICKGTDAQTFFVGLIQELRNKCDSLNGTEWFVRLEFKEKILGFEKRHKQNPEALLKIISDAISKEQELVRKVEQRGTAINVNIVEPDKSSHSSNATLTDKLQLTKRKLSDTDAGLKRIEDERQLLNLNYQELQKSEEVNQQYQRNFSSGMGDTNMGYDEYIMNLRSCVNQNFQNIANLKHYFENSISETVATLSSIQDELLDGHLDRWLKSQFLFCDNNRCTDINIVQRWCEDLVEIIWDTREQLKFSETQRQSLPAHLNPNKNGNINILANLLTKINYMLQKQIQRCFIVHSIPSQVLKTTTRFPYPHNVTVKFLVGGKLNIYMSNPQVHIEIINEKTAKVLEETGVIGKPNGVLMNNKGSRMEYDRDTGDFYTNFKNLKMVSRQKSSTTSVGAANDIVTREKFFLVCTTDVIVGDMKLKLWALSPPVVVISHGTQEAQAWATITWTNSFGGKGPSLHDVPEIVTWAEISQLLHRFTYRTLGRGLTQDNLDFLKQKAPLKDGQMTLTEFTKVQSGLEFSFWEWFFKGVKLIEKEKHLKELWADGYIAGFISKGYGEHLLSRSPTGNFLVRFSESILGAITVSWVQSEGEVYSMEPFTRQSLQTQALADKIRDLENFEYLYPNIPKDIVFKKYYCEVVQNDTAAKRGSASFTYVKPIMRMCLMGKFQSPRSRSSSSDVGSSVGFQPLSVSPTYSHQNQLNSPYPPSFQSTVNSPYPSSLQSAVNSPYPPPTPSPHPCDDMDIDNKWFEDLVQQLNTTPITDGDCEDTNL